MKAFILMADVIESSSYSGKNLMTNFKQMVASANKIFESNISSPLTITLGDEFQGIVKSLQHSIEIIFLLDELLLESKIDYRLRYVINFGEIDTPINKQSSHEMLGKGLTDARELLNEIKSMGANVLIKGLNSEKQAKLNLAFILYRSFYDDWNKKERKDAFDFLQNIDYKELARINKKAISTMWRRKKSLKIEDFKAARQLIKLIANEK